jgi:hypothetical protein
MRFSSCIYISLDICLQLLIVHSFVGTRSVSGSVGVTEDGAAQANSEHKRGKGRKRS